MAAPHDPRPIGVFDSGVGGLTVLAELHRRLPEEPTVYLGDNARAPYGPRPADEVVRFTLEAVDWLLAQDVKLLMLACNTATSRALAEVRRRSAVPVLGVVRPGAVAAAAATRAREVGVIATAGTVESGAYHEAIVEADAAIEVAQLACPELVPMVEAGILDGRRAESVLRAYLEPLRAAHPRMDTLLLGCTHYPLLTAAFRRAVGADVALVDSAEAVTAEVVSGLEQRGLRAQERSGEDHVCVTDSGERFVRLASEILHRSVRLELVDLGGTGGER